MKHALATLALVALGCGAASPPKTCTPEAREALVNAYAALGDKVIGEGACDAYADVEQCPAWLAVAANMMAARKALCP